MERDEFGKDWITEHSVQIISRYAAGVLTLRGLHYQLVAIGFPNTINHYKRVVSAMIAARWEGMVEFTAFSDHDRSMLGETKWEETVLEDKVSEGKLQVGLWMNAYRKNRWENQDHYVELFIEKKALQGVFNKPCDDHDVALGPCKGYPSLTFLHDAKDRFLNAQYEGKSLVIIYFGDYDPSGEDIPRSIGVNLGRMGVDVEVDRIALMEEQVTEWGLPPAPTKSTDTRSGSWTGIGQVELDAVQPDQLQSLAEDAILKYFDEEKYDELIDQQKEEKVEYVASLKKYVKTL